MQLSFNPYSTNYKNINNNKKVPFSSKISEIIVDRKIIGKMIQNEGDAYNVDSMAGKMYDLIPENIKEIKEAITRLIKEGQKTAAAYLKDILKDLPEIN